VLSALAQQLNRSRDLGFLGRPSVADQLAHARALLLAVPHRSEDDRLSLLDLGSGGGLPGLVAVDSCEYGRVVLLDRSEHRCAFLRSAIASLPTSSRVDVLVGLAEDLGHDDDLRESFGVVISRGFGPPASTLECGSPFLTVGGWLLVSDPPGGRAWPAEGVGLFGLEISKTHTGIPAWTLFRKDRAVDARFARTRGLPGRRPLFHV